MEKINTFRKHVAKKTNEADVKIIEQIREYLQSTTSRPVTYAEAKYHYFESKTDNVTTSHEIVDAVLEKERRTQPEMEEQAEAQIQQDADEAEEQTKKKGPLTIAETKLGITMVLSKDDCVALGFDINGITTRDAIKEVRTKLGLPEKPMRGSK